MGTELEVVVARDPVPGQEPARYIPDITCLKSELGVCPQFGLDDALARTIVWVREISASEIDNPP